MFRKRFRKPREILEMDAGSPPTRSRLAAGLQCADRLAALVEKVRDSGPCAELYPGAKT